MECNVMYVSIHTYIYIWHMNSDILSEILSGIYSVSDILSDILHVHILTFFGVQEMHRIAGKEVEEKEGVSSWLKPRDPHLTVGAR